MLNPGDIEADELRRSALDASRRSGSLVASPSHLARYSNPPQDTAFTLEYCYYLLGDVRGQNVLDYGCGAGENAVLLASRGARVFGIDISPDLIEIAQQRLQINNLSADLRVASGYDTGLPDGSMDLVFCMAVLHHLDLQMARREVLRVLKPSGVLILREPVRDSRTYSFLRKLIPYSSDLNSENERPLRVEEIDAFADGMQCEARRRFQLPFVPIARMVAPRLLRRTLHIDRWILDRVPSLGRVATVEVRRVRRMDAVSGKAQLG